MAFGITIDQGFAFGGQAISDLFGAAGDAAEGKAYKQAATYATENAQLEQESTAIQQAQLQRKITQSLGGQIAQEGAANLTGGTARYLYANSLSQGALAHGLLAVQGKVNENSYREAAAQYNGMASAAKAAQGGGIFGGFLSGVGSILGFLSDDSAKRNIRLAGPSKLPGINLYLFQYIGSDQIFKGVLASEVSIARPDCVRKDAESGMSFIDFDRLGLKMEEVNAWG